jgi:hypothetical protein
MGRPLIATLKGLGSKTSTPGSCAMSSHRPIPTAVMEPHRNTLAPTGVAARISSFAFSAVLA